MICKVMFLPFTVLRSESIEMLMAQRLPAEEKSTKEQLKALYVKLLSLVSWHRSFNFQFWITEYWIVLCLCALCLLALCLLTLCLLALCLVALRVLALCLISYASALCLLALFLFALWLFAESACCHSALDWCFHDCDDFISITENWILSEMYLHIKSTTLFDLNIFRGEGRGGLLSAV